MTEGPPNLAASTPSDADAGVDPAAYITLNFTREMNETSLRSALTFDPSIPFDVRLDPADGRRAIIAPAELLAPNTTYQVSVNTAALDIARSEQRKRHRLQLADALGCGRQVGT